MSFDDEVKYKIVKEDLEIDIYLPEKLRNYAAFGLYFYLSFLPINCVISKKDLRKVGNIGIDRLNNLMKILKEKKLIEFVRKKNEQGRFGESELHIKNIRYITW